MRENSSFTLVAIVIAIAIAGILLISATSADYTFIEEFDVSDYDEVVLVEKTADKLADGLKVITHENRKTEIDFTVEINCRNTLKILLIEEEGNIRYVSEIFSEFADDDPQGGVCEIDGTILLPKTEENKDYYLVFLFSKGDKYKKGKTITELFKEWQFGNKSEKEIVNAIRHDTVNFVSGSGNTMIVKKVKIEIQPIAELEKLIEIREEDLVWSNDKLRVIGTSSLIKDDYFYWTFSNQGDIFSKVEEEVGQNGKIEFWINTKGIGYGKYWLRIDTYGHSIEFPINLEPESTPVPEPTTEKINKLPISSSYSPEIPESTPTPTTPPDIIIPGMPEKPETPGINWLSIVFAIAATAIIIKRKK